MTVIVKGLREVNAAFAKTDRDIRLGWRAGMREVAEPVRRDAEASASASIRNMPGSPRWSRMRTGVTRTMVYVAPRQKGARRNPYARRPNLADLLMDRAMEPALARHEHEIEERIDHLVDVAAFNFNH
jgi:hypothetical protein